MKWVRRLVVALAVLLAVALIYAYTLPAATRVERTIVIDRPAATVFAQLNDFHQFNRWSPWYDLAPDETRYTFSGPRRGVGAVMHWESTNPSVGKGTQTITASEPPKSLETALEFDDFGENTAGFDLKPVDGGTEVTWFLAQEHGYDPASRLFGSMLDRFVGPDYERGLAKLKTVTEELPPEDFADLEVTEVDVPPAQWLIASTASDPNPDAESAALSQAFFAVVNALQEFDLERAGPALRIERGFDSQARFDAGIPVTGPVDNVTSAVVRVVDAYTGPALKTVHTGPYSRLSVTHAKFAAYAAAHGFAIAGDQWEVYVSDPAEVPEDQLVTDIYVPVAPPQD
ncbi:MAG: SRPBCC family protein [Pseudomonadota bacterium]